MVGLADQVGDHPMIFPQLNRFEPQCEEFGAPQPASDQHRDHGMVTSCAWRCSAGFSEQPPALFRRQPVPEAHADASEPLYAADASSQFRTEETGIGSLVRDPANGREAQIDRSGSVVALLKVNAVAKDYRAVESEAGLRAIPSDELANGVLVGTLPTGGGKAVEHSGLGVFEIGQGEDAFGRFLTTGLGMWHRRRPPATAVRQPF